MSNYDSWNNSPIMQEYERIMKEAEDKKKERKESKKSKESKKEEHKNIMEHAHPEEVTLAESLNEGGMVESNPEQQRKNIEMIYTMPNGNTSKHAFVITNLIKIASELDGQGKYGAAKEVDKAINTIYKEAQAASLISRMFAKMLGRGATKVGPRMGLTPKAFRGLGKMRDFMAKKFPGKQRKIYQSSVKDNLKDAGLAGSDMADEAMKVVNSAGGNIVNGHKKGLEHVTKRWKDATRKAENMPSTGKGRYKTKDVPAELQLEIDEAKTVMDAFKKVDPNAVSKKAGEAVANEAKRKWPNISGKALKTALPAGAVVYTIGKGITGKITSHVDLYEEMHAAADSVLPFFEDGESRALLGPVNEMKKVTSKWADKLDQAMKNKLNDPEAYRDAVEQSIAEVGPVRDDVYEQVEEYAKRIQSMPGIGDISKSENSFLNAWKSDAGSLKAMWITAFDKWSSEEYLDRITDGTDEEDDEENDVMYTKDGEMMQNMESLENIIEGIEFACDNMDQ